MVLLFEVIEGPSVGQQFKVNSGMRMGRNTGEIIINDPKVSGFHAQIERDSAGKLILVDQNSSNGLLIDGIRLQKVVLIPGVIFQVGRTFLKVMQAEEDTAAREPSGPTNWRSELEKQVLRVSGENDSQKATNLQVFRPAIRLVFTEGPQAELEQIWGYGPRKAGSSGLDLELFETGAPPTAFEVWPDPDGLRYRTSHTDLVRLNNLPSETDLLKDGDEIRIGKTLIRIDFIR